MKHSLKMGLAVLLSLFISGCTNPDENIHAGLLDRVTPTTTTKPAPKQIAEHEKIVFLPTFDDGPFDEKFVQVGVYPKSEAEMLEALHRTLAILKKNNAAAVFFVVYVSAEKDAPQWSPKSSEQRMRKAFDDGIRAIIDGGHAVALHASDHDMFHKLFLSRADAKEDMELLIRELNAAQLPYYPTWRVPYGGMRTFMNEQKLARELGVPIIQWDINAHDWTTNHDSTGGLKRLFADDRKWADNCIKNIRAETRRSKNISHSWRDVLLHVSDRTSRHLQEFLDVTAEEGKKVFGPRFTYLHLNDPEKNEAFAYYLNRYPVIDGKVQKP